MKSITMRNFLLLLLGIAIIFPACKKDDDIKTSRPDLLTEHAWKMTALVVDPAIDWIDGSMITDIYAQLPVCIKDDLITFKDNGVVTDDEGPTKCEPGDPQTESGTWSLSSDEKKVTVDSGDGPETWTILELTKDKMVVTYEFQDEETAVDYTFTGTYTKQ